MKDIFENISRMDSFCSDIAEAWVDYCKSKGKPISYSGFMHWVKNCLCPCLEYAYYETTMEVETE